MNKKDIIIISAIVSVITVSFILFANKKGLNLGSVQQTGEYHSTTTTSTYGFSDLTVLKGEGGTLGSIVVTKAGTTEMNLYNATTSDITKRTGNIATSSLLLAHIPASPTVGTYVFDTIFTNGLLISVGQKSTLSTTTITYR